MTTTSSPNPSVNRSPAALARRFKPDPFVLLLLAAVVLALLLPSPGAKTSGPLDLHRLTQIGIGLIFFLHGAAFPTAVIVENAKRWRIHALIQGTTFLLFPAIGFLLYLATRGLLSDTLRLGFFFLAALPSTISSAVALTGVARGNVPIAVFNASLSGLIGLVLTPLLLRLVQVSGGGGPSLGSAVADIARVLLLPFVAGQVARPLIGGFITRHKKRIALVDRGVILLIVYTAFASSTAAGLWSTIGIGELAATVLLVALLLAAALASVIATTRALKLSREDEVAVVFCGSTKSLANGAPIAQVVFAGTGLGGVVILPLMIYHQLQLIACASLAQRYARAASRGNAGKPAL
ncbi:bile acid:sodium symporter family protein [Parvularcula dongshanensis]|uniref:Sodium/bile acid cotransporter 7 n=1 Tax=Parvularcula dongshanensis TaxID=1173995 RepID=A0A840I5L1_9PROT|nr:bile acid:sodium symporter family protein [Parvularcula dongshanensis]MBB4660087.1 sodium/bile acid cotransporter 7 [Parvularcula dongshanensis]